MYINKETKKHHEESGLLVIYSQSDSPSSTKVFYVLTLLYAFHTSMWLVGFFQIKSLLQIYYQLHHYLARKYFITKHEIICFSFNSCFFLLNNLSLLRSDRNDQNLAKSNFLFLSLLLHFLNLLFFLFFKSIIQFIFT